MALREVAGADDEDLLPVEGPIEVPQLEAVEPAPAIRAHPRQRAARARVVAAPQPQGLEQQREPQRSSFLAPVLLEVVARDRALDGVAQEHDQLESGVVSPQLACDLGKEQVDGRRLAPEPPAVARGECAPIAGVDLRRGPVRGVARAVEEMHLLRRRHGDPGVPGEEARERGRPASLRADDHEAEHGPIFRGLGFYRPVRSRPRRAGRDLRVVPEPIHVTQDRMKPRPFGVQRMPAGRVPSPPVHLPPLQGGHRESPLRRRAKGVRIGFRNQTAPIMMAEAAVADAVQGDDETPEGHGFERGQVEALLGAGEADRDPAPGQQSQGTRSRSMSSAIRRCSTPSASSRAARIRARSGRL